jgi:hypothetical protein
MEHCAENAAELLKGEGRLYEEIQRKLSIKK